jgi:hypothetical protein
MVWRCQVEGSSRGLGCAQEYRPASPEPGAQPLSPLPASPKLAKEIGKRVDVDRLPLQWLQPGLPARRTINSPGPGASEPLERQSPSPGPGVAGSSGSLAFPKLMRCADEIE